MPQRVVKFRRDEGSQMALAWVLGTRDTLVRGLFTEVALISLGLSERDSEEFKYAG